MSLNAYERETIISLCDGEDTATVYTASPKWMRKFDKLSSENPEEFKELTERRQFDDEGVVSKMYTMPKECVSSRRGRQKLSEEQRAVMAERMKALRASKA